MNTNSIRDLLKNPEIYKFAIVGILGSSIVLLLSAMFTSAFGIFYAMSVLIALEISLIPAFYFHDKWTFSKVTKINKPVIRFFKFNIVSFIGFGINESVLIFLTSRMGIHYIVSEIIAIIITFVFNYAVNKKVSWKR